MDDFDVLKAALANWSARNNFLIDKWTKELTIAGQYDDFAVGLIERFIGDLKASALSDYDFRDDIYMFEHKQKKRVDATLIDLLDGDYVRQLL